MIQNTSYGDSQTADDRNMLPNEKKHTNQV